MRAAARSFAELQPLRRTLAEGGAGALVILLTK